MAELINSYMAGTLDFSTRDDIQSLDEKHAATHYNVDLEQAGESGTSSYSQTWLFTTSLSDPYVISSDANDGKDENPQCPCPKGMPAWSVSEPYLNLWVRDMPVFYRTSLGEEIQFQLAYKQRDTRPVSETVPVTGWSHNWYSYIRFVVPTFLAVTNTSTGVKLNGPTGPVSFPLGWSFTNDFSQWEAILYTRNNGEEYFKWNDPSRYESGRTLAALDGANAHIYPNSPENPGGTNGVAGFKLTNPDGSVDEYTLVTTPTFSFGIARNRGSVYDMGSAPPRQFAVATTTYHDSGTNNYDNDADAQQEPPVGQKVGYVACDALWTKHTDRYGNSIQLSYNSGPPYRLAQLLDYDGKTTTFGYDANGMLNSVAMPYGRSALMNYAGQNLTQIQDAAGMSSSLTYQTSPLSTLRRTGTNDYVTSITTPYGTNTFEHFECSPIIQSTNPSYIHHFRNTASGTGQETLAGDQFPLYLGWLGAKNKVNRACRVTHPDNSHELYLYRYDSRNLVPGNYPAEEMPPDVADDGQYRGIDDYGDIDHLLSTRNSYHWNRQQYPYLTTTNFNQLVSADYKLVTLKHWLQRDVTQNIFPGGLEQNVSDQISFMREPSPDGEHEGVKTWFTHDGQSAWKASEESAFVNARTVLPYEGVREWQSSLSGGRMSSYAESYTLEDGSTELRYTSWEYDPSGQLTAYSDPSGYLNVTYTTNNSRMDVSDADGTSTYFYNARHQLAGVKYASGLTRTNLYGADGFLAKSIALETHATNIFSFTNGLPATRTTALGLPLNYSWDKLDRLTQVSYPDGTTVVNGYDKLDVVAHKDRLGNWTYAAYDTMRQPKSYTDARNHTTLLEYCFCGALAKITDSLGNWTAFDRDYDGNIIIETSSDGFKTGYQRDLVGQVRILTNSAGANLTYSYNNQGLVTQVANVIGPVFAAAYDMADRPVRVTDDRGVSSTNYFDAKGRLTERWDAHGRNFHNEFGSPGILSHQDALYHVTTYGYDPAGRLAEVIDGNGNTNDFTYNPLGQLATLIDGNKHVTTWTYDSQGRQVQKRDGNNSLIETNGYNVNGWLTKHWTPAKALTSYSLDNNGNLTGITYSSGPGVTATYDDLNRLATLADAVGNSVFTYTNFGAFASALATEDGPWASDTVTHSYLKRLQQSLTLAQPSGNWSESFGYDNVLRLKTINNPTDTFTYNYNGAGRKISQLTLPGNVIDYDYDGAGSLLSTVLKHGGTVLDAYTYVYDANGNRASVTRKDNRHVDYGYDAIGQLVSATGYEPDGETLRGNENLGYAFDHAGNLLLRTNNTLVQTFTTDGANQLLNVSRNNNLLTVAGSLSTNNTTSLAINGQAATLYGDQTFAVTNGVAINNGYNVLTAVANGTLTNQTAQVLPVTAAVGNDANGNLINDGLHAYEYDCANELAKLIVTNILKTEFVYDGLGRKRILKEFAWQTNQWVMTNEVHYIFDGMLVIQERNSANVPQVSYTRGLDMSGTLQSAGGIGGLLARTDANGSAFYHADGNGNITMLVDSSGSQKAKYLYDPFGNPLGMWGVLAEPNKIRFSSKEFYAGMYDFGFRWYIPNLGRWNARDPIEEFGGINLYGYVGNNPVSYQDFLGLYIKFGPWVFGDAPTWIDSSGQEHYDTPPSQSNGEEEESDPVDQLGKNGNYTQGGARWTKGHCQDAANEAKQVVIDAAMIIAGVATGGIGEAGEAGEAANLANNANKCKSAANAAKKLSKSESPIWKALKSARGKTKTNGLSGKDKRFYEWDHTHGDIEVYDARGNHLGSMDASSGNMTKPPVQGYKIDI